MIDYEFTDNNGVKFINVSPKEYNVKVIGIIIGTNLDYTHYGEFNLKPGNWFIPNIRYDAFSSIKIYIDDVYNFHLSLDNNKNYNKFKSKIIGIGLNKTGTTSFRDSMGMNGFKVFNEYYGHQYLLQDVHNKNIYSTLSFLESPLFDLYEDLPFSLLNFYKEIYEHRPQDYYVLTVRNNVEEWVESAYKFYSHDINDINLKKDYKIHRITNIGNKQTVLTKNYLTLQMINWGINGSGNIKNQFRDTYNRHLDDVTNFFSKKFNSNFITINVSKENELKRLSNFIGFETTENNFVWSNKSKK